MMKLTHGGDIYSYKEKYKEEALDYSANINPLGMPRGVKQALINSIDTWVNYPDPLCRELKKELAHFEKVKEDYLVLGNGAAEVIFKLIYAAKPKKAMVLEPTFSEYEEALKSVNAEVFYHYLKEENNFRLTEDILGALNEDLDMIFICNPNNPTGEIAEKDLLIKVMAVCKQKGIILVLDECFNDFLDEPAEYTMKEFLADNDHLFILKAFTKIYAMAGVRLGYGLTSNLELINEMAKTCQPWSVSIPAQIAGIQALKEEEYLKATKVLIKEEREYLISNLKELGFKVYGSKANYLFFSSSNDNLKAKLEKQGIMIRDCSNYPGLKAGYYRICVKTHQDNERLINALKAVRG